MGRIEPVKIQKVLSTEEKVDYGKKLAQLIDDGRSLERDKKEVVADFKSKIEKNKADQDKISNALRDGWIHVTFSGQKRKNYEQGVWEYLDSVGQIVSTEKFSPSDYQMTTEDVEAADDNEYDDGEGVDADLDALERNVVKDDNDPPAYPDFSQEAQSDIPEVHYPGSDYIPEGDYTPNSEKGAQPRKGGKFTKKNQ